MNDESDLVFRLLTKHFEYETFEYTRDKRVPSPRLNTSTFTRFAEHFILVDEHPMIENHMILDS